KTVAAKYPNVKLTVFDAKFTTNVQVNQLRDALVSNKYQAWFIGPNDGGPLTPTIKQAIAKGVKVGCALVPCGPNIRDVNVQIPGQVIFSGLGFYPNGQLLGQGVVKACASLNPCEVLWLPGLPTLPLEVARQDGLYQVIKPHKNIKVVAVAAGGYLAAPALTATTNILRAHPPVVRRLSRAWFHARNGAGRRSQCQRARQALPAGTGQRGGRSELRRRAWRDLRASRAERRREDDDRRRADDARAPHARLCLRRRHRRGS